ncbi:MAG: hypothetical protein DDG59_11500 [Anaerolineae bacterium]|jgi:hypothetical protein|nr:MAG: hypothetical protein DDG59_11500 [Anaerolineae bacterium]
MRDFRRAFGVSVRREEHPHPRPARRKRVEQCAELVEAPVETRWVEQCAELVEALVEARWVGSRYGGKNTRILDPRAESGLSSVLSLSKRLPKPAGWGLDTG